MRVAVAAAAGLTAVAFVPVFAGFAADNTGLIAAGRAASESEGMLVTDSPVVAFLATKPRPTSLARRASRSIARSDLLAAHARSH